jgi:hypothetical protein
MIKRKKGDEIGSYSTLLTCMQILKGFFLFLGLLLVHKIFLLLSHVGFHLKFI